MMKSFFKKLAFVMALAMVVSAMAPAATAKAAEVKTVDICVQNDNYIARPTYGLTEGDATAVDFCFAGAPDWKNYTWTWDSSDKEVATVDNAGLVTFGTKTGTTTITVKGGDVYTGSMVLTVNPKVVVPAYEVKQVASNKVTITWADAKAASTNVTLYKVFTLTSGEKEPVKWPCKVETKDGVATVVPYVDFDDNGDYTLDINGEKYDFTAYVGKINKIEVVPKDVKTNGTTLYACAEDPYRPIRFDVKFITEGGMEVSQPEDTSVYYEVIEADDEVQVDNEGACSYITAVGKSAVIKAIYYYTDEKGEAQELEDEFIIVGEEIPVAKLDAVADYAVTAMGTKVADVKWSKAELIYGEEAYVALKLADSLKGVYYTDTTLTLGEKDVAFENVTSDDVKIQNSAFGTITYMSSDETKLLVGANDGKLTAIGTDGSAVVIVKLTTYDANGNANEPKNIYAFEIALKSERKADKVTATGTTVLVADNANGTLAQSGKITFTVVDQYGNPWINWDTVKAETTVKDAPKTLTITQDKDKDGNLINAGTILVNGSDFAEVVKQAKTSVTYTIDIDGAKTPVTITLKNPPVFTEDGVTSVKTTGFLAEATGTDIDGSKSGVITATINTYETWTSNGVKYKVNNVDPEKLIAYEHNDGKFWSNNAKELAVGSIVVMVQKPDGKYITPSINASTGAITVPVATVEAGEKLSIEAEGTYNVTLYKVTAATKKTANDTTTYKIDKLSAGSTTFVVNNKCAKMSVSFDTTKPLKSDASFIEQVIVDLAKFKLGDKDTTVTASMLKVNGVYNDSADKYYVKNIVVKTPVGTTGSYFEETLNVGLTFEVPGMPDAK